MSQIVGRVLKKDAEVIVIFRVAGKYYPSTEYNNQIFETYLHNGNTDLLHKLENEIDL